jgi:hypothetical protein
MRLAPSCLILQLEKRIVLQTGILLMIIDALPVHVFG